MTDKKVVKFTAKKDSTKNITPGKECCCSFCGRPESKVLKMVKAPNANICSECTMIAIQYLVIRDSIPEKDSLKVLKSFWSFPED